MHRRGQNDRGSENGTEGTGALDCNHVWRVRDITFALPGRYVTEVCERCGALHIAGPDTASQQVATWKLDRPWRRDGLHLEDLERRRSAPADRPSAKG